MSVRIQLGSRSYSIEVASSYQKLPSRLAALKLPKHGWVISHQSILRRYRTELLNPLRKSGWNIQVLTVPESESSKSLKTMQRAVDSIAKRTKMRIPVLFAFGGGVVGDLTGFIASIYRRGVPYVQLPTTLLAQVDSAIGGKVGVDMPHAKNLMGSIYQPRMVFNNTSVLKTLPDRQRRTGLAEIIKYGVIADPKLFSYLEHNMPRCLDLQASAIKYIVERSCRIKARTVSLDERETTGVRAQLNFGHTLGHAIEAATQYKRWTHGEAIAIGMCAAMQIGVELGLCPKEHYVRLVNLIKSAGLPVRDRSVSRKLVIRALQYDKKFINGRPRWVVPQRIGKVIVTESIPKTLMQRVINEYIG